MPDAYADRWSSLRLGETTASPNPPDAIESTPAAIRFGRVLLASVLLFGCFWTIEHDPASFAGLQVADNTEQRIRNDFIDSIEDGSSSRKAIFVSFGLFGLAALALCRDTPWNPRRGGVIALALLLTWTAASVLWAEEPSLVARRLAVLSMVLTGALGLARMLRPNEYLTVCLLTFGAFVSLSLALDTAAGGKLWSSDYRFGGTLHPNIQAAYCGVLCLAAFCQPTALGGRWLVRGLFGFGLTMLLLTQSRTSLLALVVGLLMCGMVRLAPVKRWTAAALLVGVAAFATVVISSLGDGGKTRLTEAVLLGRTEQAGSLTGRVPLWEDLWDYAAERPWTGYGYDSFWTPDHIAEVMKSQGWALQSAHNGYFDVALQLGLIGLTLALAWTVTGANLVQAAYAQTSQVGLAFLYGVLSFAFANSLLESHFSRVKFPTVVALIGLLHVIAFFPTWTKPEDRDEDERPDWSYEVDHWRRELSRRANRQSDEARRGSRTA